MLILFSGSPKDSLSNVSSVKWILYLGDIILSDILIDLSLFPAIHVHQLTLFVFVLYSYDYRQYNIVLSLYICLMH